MAMQPKLVTWPFLLNKIFTEVKYIFIVYQYIFIIFTP